MEEPWIILIPFLILASGTALVRIPAIFCWVLEQYLERKKKASSD